MIKAIYEKPISNRVQAKKTEKYFFKIRKDIMELTI